MRSRVKVYTALAFLALGLSACGDDGRNGVDGQDGANGTGQVLTLSALGSSASQGFDVSAAEIVAFAPVQKQILTVNAQSGLLDVFDVSDPTQLPLIESLDVIAMLMDVNQATDLAAVGAANSVAVFGDRIAVAVKAVPKTNPGWVLFIATASHSFVNAVTVGALPDMLSFTPDGSQVAACEAGPGWGIRGHSILVD